MIASDVIGNNELSVKIDDISKDSKPENEFMNLLDEIVSQEKEEVATLDPISDETAVILPAAVAIPGVAKVVSDVVIVGAAFLGIKTAGDELIESGVLSSIGDIDDFGDYSVKDKQVNSGISSEISTLNNISDFDIPELNETSSALDSYTQNNLFSSGLFDLSDFSNPVGSVFDSVAQTPNSTIFPQSSGSLDWLSDNSWTNDVYGDTNLSWLDSAFNPGFQAMDIGPLVNNAWGDNDALSALMKGGKAKEDGIPGAVEGDISYGSGSYEPEFEGPHPGEVQLNIPEVLGIPEEILKDDSEDQLYSDWLDENGLKNEKMKLSSEYMWF